MPVGPGSVGPGISAPAGTGGGGSGTVTSVSNADGTITVSGTPNVAPVVSRAALTGDVTASAGSNATTVATVGGASATDVADASLLYLHQFYR